MKINVAVLFGGKSTEHEVSIISALQAIENLDKEKYQIFPIYISKNNEFYYDDKLLLNINNYSNINELLNKAKKVVLFRNDNNVYLKNVATHLFEKDIIDKIEIVFPIVHGTNVEDGNLQGYIKTLGLPFVGCDCISSALGMDKYYMKKILMTENIPVLDALKFDLEDYKNINETVNFIENKFSYPVIVKPVNLGSSIGISKSKNKDELINALNLAFSFAEQVIVERAITNLREINCAILGNKYEQRTSVLEEPFGKDEILSFKDKYLSGGSKESRVSNPIKFGCKNVGGTKNLQGMTSLTRKVPADVDKEIEIKIKDYAKKTFKILGCSGVARVDMMIDKDTNSIYVNEINTIPGSLSYYLWDFEGISYKSLLDELIKIAIDNKRREDSLNWTFNNNLLAGN